jgi:cobalt-zinc-cadmium efflux system membrane fusion protein
MYLSALVETGAARVPALPDEAVIDYQGRKYIFVATTDEHKETGAHDDTIANDGRGEQHFSMLEVLTSESEFGFSHVVVPDSILKSKVVIKGAYELLSKLKNSDDEPHAH